MKKRISASTGAMLLLAGLSGTADAEGPWDAENFSANVGFTTNYIFRGETQTDDEPAIQGGFDWEYSGFYVGIWGSNVDFDAGDSIEIDYYGGYAGELGPFEYDINLIYYAYPGANDDGFEFDYFEVIPSISYTFDAPLEPSIHLLYGYSPEYFGEEGDGDYVESGLSLTFGDFGIDGAVGYQWIDGDNSGDEIEWLTYHVGVTTSALGFDFDLRYHRTEEEGIDWLANDDFPDDEFVVFSVNRSF